MRRGTPSRVGLAHELRKTRLEFLKRPLERAGPRQQHQIASDQKLPSDVAVRFAQSPARAVPLHGVSKLLARCKCATPPTRLSRQNEEYEAAVRKTLSLGEDRLHGCALAQPFVHRHLGRNPLPALEPTKPQHAAPVRRLHPCPKPMNLRPTAPVRLERPLHAFSTSQRKKKH